MNGTRLVGRVWLPLALTAALSSSVYADSLQITTDQNTLHPWEPLSVMIFLTVDESSAKQLALVDENGLPIVVGRRRFRAVLKDEGDGVISNVNLFLEWETPNEANPTLFACKGIAILVTQHNSSVPSPNGYRLAQPGTYTISVVDRRHSVESNAVGVRILPLWERESEAAKLFVKALPDGIGLIMEQQASDETTMVFRKLVEEYGDTDLGHLARLSLTLKQAKAVTDAQGGGVDPQKWMPIGNAIAGALSNLPRDHPLRERALFELAASRVRSEQPNEALAAIDELQQSYPKGKWARRGTRLKGELTIRRESGGRSPK